MTNPLPHPGPDASLPADNGAATEQTAKTRRKAPRRATAPAGAPAKTATPALMLVDAAGKLVPSALPAHDAGDSPLPEPVPAAEVESSNETPIAPAEAEVEGEVEAETEVATAVEVEAEVEEPAAAETAAAAEGEQDTAAEDEPEAAEAPADAEIEPTTDTATKTEPETTAEAEGEVETEAEPAAEVEEPAAAETAAAEEGEQAAVEAKPEAAEVAAEAEVEKPADSEAKTGTQPEVDEPSGAQEPDAEVSEAESNAATEAPVAETGITPDVAAGIDAPDRFAETIPEAADVGHDGNPAKEPLPQSRRERRLAEQKLGSAVVPQKTETGAETARPAEEVTEPAPAKPARKRGRLAGVLRGILFLLVISALVLSLGTVLSSTADNHAGPSETEADRQSAWEATNSLLEQAAELGTAGHQPEVQELLAQTATDLATQSAALSDGLPPGTATATASPTAPAPATLEALVLGLRTNGESLLKDAVGADHAMGRVFAAVGSSQLLRSQAVAAAADLGSASSPALPASVNFPAPDAPECSSTLDPRPGATVDAALLAAAEGEQKAVYAYQVATANLSQPQSTRGTQLLARHEAKLSSLNAELEVRCLPGTSLVPGFVLDAAFTTHPAAALASLEGELAGVYADLAALSTAPSTGTATTPGGLPANTTQLREMAVAWLLDSADTQAGWGGSVGALAGMDSHS